MEHTANPQTDCPLFALTPELRNIVWSFLFTGPQQRSDRGVKIRRCENQPAEQSCLTVLQTCRRVHNEVCGLFYWNNRLELVEYYNHRHFTLFTRSLRHNRLDSIRDVNISVNDLELVTATCKIIPRLKSLREVLFVHNIRADWPLGRESWMFREFVATVKRESLILRRLAKRLSLESIDYSIAEICNGAHMYVDGEDVTSVCREIESSIRQTLRRGKMQANAITV